MYSVLLFLYLLLASLGGTVPRFFFPPLHFSVSFNLPHCGVILESSLAGSCLSAFSLFSSCSAIIKCTYQHSGVLWAGSKKLHVCVSHQSFDFTLRLLMMCTPTCQWLPVLSDNPPLIVV